MFYVQTSNIYGAVASFSNTDYNVVKGLYDALCGAQDMAYVQLGGVGTGVMEHCIIQAFVPDYAGDAETLAYAASVSKARDAGLFDGDEVVQGRTPIYDSDEMPEHPMGVETDWQRLERGA